ncbi:MAG TPA: glycerol-3-phosphate dehydrogenase C-terminal domain-containing protein, partial [Myxococcota bacterium]|nr:glycerol-3-phosphate dehydrogenase C-terminal domain-containing protein [Myxococcota bacterium]
TNNNSLKSRLVEGFPYIEAEVIYGVRNEYALHASDILGRRLRLAFLSHDAALKALPRVIELMAKELSWDEAKKKDETLLGLDFLQTMFTA